MKDVGPWHAWTVLSNQTRPPSRVPGEHYSNITKPLISYERGWPLACLDGLIKPNQASNQGAR
jgi:hypothetical protein